VFRNENGGWSEVAKLTASDGAPNDQFSTVAISGNTIVVGAAQPANGGPGAIYVFQGSAGNNKWPEIAKLTASDSAGYDHFGASVAISNDIIVVGAHWDDDDGDGSGSVYVFRDSSADWIEVAKLTASSGSARDHFGLSVAISGTTIVVGAPGDDDKGDGSGSVYVFHDSSGSNDWSEVAKLTASDGAAGEDFGISVAISGSAIVVGAYQFDTNSTKAGCAYIFRDANGNGDWSETVKVTASDGVADDYFGISVAASGEIIAVGAYGDDDGGERSGSAYIYEPLETPAPTPEPTISEPTTPDPSTPDTATQAPTAPTSHPDDQDSVGAKQSAEKTSSDVVFIVVVVVVGVILIVAILAGSFLIYHKMGQREPNVSHTPTASLPVAHARADDQMVVNTVFATPISPIACRVDVPLAKAQSASPSQARSSEVPVLPANQNAVDPSQVEASGGDHRPFYKDQVQSVRPD
jgi:hypothetical protein